MQRPICIISEDRSHRLREGGGRTSAAGRPQPQLQSSASLGETLLRFGGICKRSKRSTPASLAELLLHDTSGFVFKEMAPVEPIKPAQLCYG